ncbi:MAG: hypothetical protein NVSMB17_04930 [Candidatus Dormibacteria bacterium]
MRSSPLLTFSAYLAFLALATALAASLGGVDLLRRPGRRWKLASRVLDREVDLASSLGWSRRAWFSLRGAAVGVAALAAIGTGIPLLVPAAPLATAFAVPYLLAGRAASRRLQRERTLVDWVRTVASRMRRNQGIDVILRDTGVHPPYGLEWVMAPLADTSLLLDEALVAFAGRARIAEAEMLVLALLASRTRRQEDLVVLLETVVLPVMEARLAEQVDALEATTQKRSQAIAMSLIMLGMFFALIRVEAIRRGYGTLPGQALLVVVGVTFGLVLLLVSRLYRTPTFTRWDLDAYCQELRAVGSV